MVGVSVGASVGSGVVGAFKKCEKLNQRKLCKQMPNTAVGSGVGGPDGALVGLVGWAVVGTCPAAKKKRHNKLATQMIRNTNK